MKNKETKEKLILILILTSTLLSILNSTVYSSGKIYTYLTFAFIIIAFLISVTELHVRNKTLIFFLILSFFMMLSVIVNQITKNPGFEGGVNLISTVITLFLLINQTRLRTNISLKRIKHVLLLVIYITILLSYLNYFGIYMIDHTTNFYGFSWIFLNPNSYGPFLLFLLIVTYLFIEKRNKKFILFFLIYLLIILSLSRTAILGGAIIIISYLFNELRKKKFFLRTVLIVIVLLMVASLIDFGDAFVNLESKFDGGTSSRTEIWRIVLSEYIFNSNKNLFFGDGMAFGAIESFRFLSPHNSYLLIWAKYGLINLLLVLIVIILTFFALPNRKLWIPIFVTVLFIGFFESYMFNGLNYMWLATIFSIKAYNLIEKESLD